MQHLSPSKLFKNPEAKNYPESLPQQLTPGQKVQRHLEHLLFRQEEKSPQTLPGKLSEKSFSSLRQRTSNKLQTVTAEATVIPAQENPKKNNSFIIACGVAGIALTAFSIWSMIRLL